MCLRSRHVVARWRNVFVWLLLILVMPAPPTKLHHLATVARCQPRLHTMHHLTAAAAHAEWHLGDCCAVAAALVFCGKIGVVVLSAREAVARCSTSCSSRVRKGCVVKMDGGLKCQVLCLGMGFYIFFWHHFLILEEETMSMELADCCIKRTTLEPRQKVLVPLVDRVKAIIHNMLV